MKRTRLNLLALVSVLAFIISSCNSDDDVNGPDQQGTANVSATDAAIAAENVTGVYLAVKGIAADGTDDANDASVMFDATQEFNIMAYQNGEVFDIGSIDLNAGSYSSISLILDESAPGYITYEDGTEADLDIEGETEYQVVGDFEIEENAQTDLVADIDLRKAFKETSTEGEFMLRSTARLVAAGSTGTIEGTVENYEELKTDMESRNVEGKLVVFAYQKGTFSSSEETDNDGDGPEGRFESSINSAIVAEDGTFTLAFMEASEYDIVVCNYEKSKDAPEEDPFYFQSSVDARLSVDAALSAILSGIGVSAESSTNISVIIGMQ